MESVLVKLPKQEPFRRTKILWTLATLNKLLVVCLSTLIFCERTDGSENSLATVAQLIKWFVPLHSQREFYDTAFKALATEDGVNVDGTIKTLFTELWFPVEKTTEVMQALEELYQDPSVALGNFAVEIYGAKNSLSG